MSSSCPAHWVRARVCYTCPWGFKFKYLQATGVILLFIKLTVSIIPHYSTTIPVRKDGDEFWQRAQENLLEAQEEMPCFSLQPWFHSFSRNCLWAYLDRALRAAMARSTQELNLARSGECWVGVGGGGAGSERCCDADQLFSGPWETSHDLTLLSSRPSACPDARCHVTARITDLNRMKQWGQILATEIYHQSINPLLIPDEFLKKNT